MPIEMPKLKREVTRSISDSSSSDESLQPFSPATSSPVYNRAYMSLSKCTVPSACSIEGPGNVLVDAKLNVFNPALLRLGPPKKMAYGGGKLDILYDGRPLRFQTPILRVPFGLNVYTNPKGQSNVLELAIHGPGVPDDTLNFFKQLRLLDSIVLDELTKRRAEILPGLSKIRCPDERLWERHIACTRARESKEGAVYPPRLTVKCWRNAQLWSKDHSDGMLPVEITKDAIPQNTWMTTIIECTGVWVGTNSTSVGFRLVQGRLEDDQRVPMQAAAPLFV